jgi:hypothetical protein
VVEATIGAAIDKIENTKSDRVIKAQNEIKDAASK